MRRATRSGATIRVQFGETCRSAAATSGRLFLPGLMWLGVGLIVLAACSSDGSADAEITLPSPDGEIETNAESDADSDSTTSTTSDDDSSSSESSTSSSLDSTTSTSREDTTPSGASTVRVGSISIERTEPCPDVTVAPTFSLAMTSDAGPESVTPATATQIAVAEGTPTKVAPAASFTVEGAWSLNVQMLEHLTGTMRGATHTEPTRLTDRIDIDGVPVDISWSVTQSGDRVDVSPPEFVVSPSCVQILPGTMIVFTETDGSGPVTVGSTDPSFAEPIDLPVGRPVVVSDGAEFETSSSTGWTLIMTVTEHWNGRNYDSGPHTSAGSVEATFPNQSNTGHNWVVRYTIEN